MTPDEHQALTAALRSSDAVVLRRAQILLASARGERAPHIAHRLGCNDQTVRTVLQACNARGLGALPHGASRPKTTPVAFGRPTAERLRALLHQLPRTFGKETSLWTLDLAVEVRFEQGLTTHWVSRETIRATLRRLGVSWQRAKHWITSPDPKYTQKKRRRDRLIRLAARHPTWALGFMDAVWWSRVAQPALHAWTADQPLRVVEQPVAKDAPDPNALAWYGVLLPGLAHLWLRFVAGRPVRSVTTPFLAWVCDRLGALGKTAWLLIWDNASWHVSREVRTWMQNHNQRVRREGGVRIVSCLLPGKSPWLNPIEPHWVHGKRRVVEPARLLTADELAPRVCATFACVHETHLAIPDQVS